MNARSCLLVAAALAALSSVGSGCSDTNPSRDDSADLTAQRDATGLIGRLRQRPLDLPRVHLQGGSIAAAGIAGRCVGSSQGGVAVNAIALPGVPGEGVLGPGPGLAALERGPVYVALRAGPPRVVQLGGLLRLGPGRSWAAPTTWVSRHGYRGPVLIRGGRIDRPGPIGFGSDLHPRHELLLPAGSWSFPRVGDEPPAAAIAPRWRAAAVPTRIRRPGCYAFQVDGRGFSYVFPFGAQN